MYEEVKTRKKEITTTIKEAKKYYRERDKAADALKTVSKIAHE